MSLIYEKYIYIVVIVFAILFMIRYLLLKKYFKFIHLHWFLKRSYLNKISSFFYYLFIITLFVSVLDIRGPEEKVESTISDQKTLILIDASLSMLAEDVKPNRFSHAIMTARHFIKKSAGHQIGVVLFSDIQKKVIPFTNDIDLLDSRLSAFSELKLVAGGSNLVNALRESVKYFHDSSAQYQNTNGNV